MDISEKDAETILSWFEYATEESFHYGGGALAIPEEQRLVGAMKSCAGKGSAAIYESEIRLISDWMTRAISRKYGSAKFVFGAERDLYYRISAAVQNWREESVSAERDFQPDSSEKCALNPEAPATDTNPDIFAQLANHSKHISTFRSYTLQITVGLSALFIMAAMIWIISRFG